MNPSQLEHLKLIDAHLERLLAIAEKRTPGEWKVNEGVEVHQLYTNEEGSNTYIGTITGFSWGSLSADEGRANTAFIASCAGNAEAGWKATRAAIADWLSLYNATEGYADGAPDASAHDKLCNEVASVCRINLQHILAAFPLELIQKP